MGINGLLPALADITKQRHIRHFRGQKGAIDAYCWLHKAAYQCAQELARGQGLEKLIASCVARINLFLNNDVIPVVIFDGGKLKMKKGVEKERGSNRERAKQEANEYLAKGDEQMAMRKFSESIDITPQMAHAFILALRELKVEYYVAPYEADAQLAYLFHTNHVQFIITEDSDLLAFGVDVAFYKMDNNGNGYEVDMKKLNKVKQFKDFNREMFLIACIFSGCDYLESIKGIGFKKAVKLVDDGGKSDTFLEAMTILRSDKKIEIPSKYEKHFMRAFLTFKFQRVFCPQRKKLVHLFDPLVSPHGSDLDKFEKKDFLGQDLSDEVVCSIAYGDMDPVSKEKFKDDENEKYLVRKALGIKNSYTSNYNNNFQKKDKKKKKDKDDDSEEETPLPKFLKDNPEQKYMDLWNQHPRLFWRQYWIDRKAGLIDKNTDPIKDHGADPNFGVTGNTTNPAFQRNKWKKFKKKKDKKDKKKKKKNAEEEDESEGEDAKPMRGIRKKQEDDRQTKLNFDLSIQKSERNAAIDSFIKKTGFDMNSEADLRTAQQLKRMRNEETENELQKMQAKYKRMRELKEAKKIKEDKKRDFMKQIEDTAIMATQMQTLTQNILSQKQNGFTGSNIKTLEDLSKQAESQGIGTPGSQGLFKGSQLGEINFGKTPLDRQGPTKEFEKEFLKAFDEKGYKAKYGKTDKQNIMPPSYIRKRGQDFKFSQNSQKKHVTLNELLQKDEGGIYEDKPQPTTSQQGVKIPTNFNKLKTPIEDSSDEEQDAGVKPNSLLQQLARQKA